MSGGQHGGPRLKDCPGLASVHDGWCQQTDSRVAVLLVVLAKEPAAEVESVVLTGEAVWEVGPVLQRLELALGEGVVVNDMGSAVGLGSGQVWPAAARRPEIAWLPRGRCGSRVDRGRCPP